MSKVGHFMAIRHHYDLGTEIVGTLFKDEDGALAEVCSRGIDDGVTYDIVKVIRCVKVTGTPQIVDAA